MQTTFIYSLADGNNIRYVGKANKPNRRFRTHLKDSYASHKCTWIKGLLDKGIKPIMEIVDEVPLSEWEFWECWYIDLFKSWGFDLVNMNEGGTGGTVLTKEACEKISKVKKGSTISDEHRKAIAESNRRRKMPEDHPLRNFWKGKKQSEEHKTKRNINVDRFTDYARQKALEANIGRKLTEDHKNKISPLGRKHSEATKEKMKIACSKRDEISEETRTKMKASQKLRWHKQKQLQNETI